MNALLSYVQELEHHVTTQQMPWEQWQTWCCDCLNGGPATELRKAAQLSAMKAHGTFFTSPTLARTAASKLPVRANADQIYLDPNCGAGDLLLAVAQRLPLQRTVLHTLSRWGQQLSGCDIHSTFIRATKARLALLAMRRLRSREQIDTTTLQSLFPAIRTADALNAPAIYAPAAHVLMNPPFVPIDAPTDCTWSTGRTNSAAYFTAHAILQSKTATRMVAILPDVVRSGSRYARWRRFVAANATIDEVDTYGVFDRHTDVDVFLLSLRVGNTLLTPTHEPWEADKSGANDTISKHFTIHVGSVVPHRHAEIGPAHPYADVVSLPPWAAVPKLPKMRRFSGRVFPPPFVALRRTSSPTDSKRCIATIVLGSTPVAVENHLLVCLPNDNSTESCHALVTHLQDSQTDKWLNRRIRCRHLTVSAVAQTPWSRLP